jgi:hypothetical protein
MSMKSRAFLATLLLVAASSNCFAGTWCSENILQIKVYPTGAVIFITDQTCGNGCQVGGSTDAIVNRGYSLLLAAKTAGKPVTFYWSNISSCSTANAGNEVPAVIDLDN